MPSLHRKTAILMFQKLKQTEIYMNVHLFVLK